MSRRGNWNRALYKNRPHGLQGKDIGLYYKELQMKKNKTKDKGKDVMVSFLSIRIL